MKIRKKGRKRKKKIAFLHFGTKRASGCDRPDLLWRPSEVRQFAPQFSEIASMRTVRDLPDEKLLERLILLCGDLDRVFPDMSQPFCDFNKKGLKAQSFAKYGDKLLELAETKLSTKGIGTISFKQLADW